MSALAPAAFTALAARTLAEARPALAVSVVRDLVLRVRAPGGVEALTRLDNLLAEARRDPAGPARALARLVESADAALGNAPVPAGDERAAVLPLLRHADHVARMWAARPGAPRLPARPVAGPVWCCYGVDLPGAVRILSREAADRLALSDARLHALALDNLRRRLVPELLGDGPLWQVVSGGTWDGAWLLDDALWARIAARIPGTLAVALPARDVLLVTSLAIPGGVAELRAVATRARRDVDHPLWEGVLVRTPGGWAVSPPSPGGSGSGAPGP